MRVCALSVFWGLLGCGGSEGVGANDPGSGAAPATGGSGAGASNLGGAAPGVTGISAEDCFAPVMEPDFRYVEVQRLRSIDGSVKLWRARQVIDAPTVGETTAYALVRFWITSERDEGACISSRAAMSYAYAHHNWDERWTARTSSTEYVGTQVFMSGGDVNAWQDTLSANSLEGQPIGGSVALSDAGCISLPYDLNACSLRSRLDMPPPGWE